MRVHFILHEAFEAPGAIENWSRERSHPMSFTRTYAGDPLPTSANEYDFLVIMGGPQSPATTPKECPYFHAAEEIACIQAAIQDGKHVLGVCLGAQLIGEALGAPYAHSPYREIGVFEITLTPAAVQDPLLVSFPPKLLVGHWHGDMPGLTPAAEVLACSEGCPRQIVRYSPRVYGFQCHLEFTAETMTGMIAHCAEDLALPGTHPYIEDAMTLQSHDYHQMNQYLYNFLDAFTFTQAS